MKEPLEATPLRLGPPKRGKGKAPQGCISHKYREYHPVWGTTKDQEAIKAEDGTQVGARREIGKPLRLEVPLRPKTPREI